jgi:hypothetical protein
LMKLSFLMYMSYSDILAFGAQTIKFEHMYRYVHITVCMSYFDICQLELKSCNLSICEYCTYIQYIAQFGNMPYLGSRKVQN